MRLNDIEVGVTDIGSGEPIVFLHGLAEDRMSWSPQLDVLEGYRRVAIDLRGHGETTVGDAEESLHQLSTDLVAVLENVTGPAAVAGFSLGGIVVLRTAIDRPDLVRHPIAMATSSVVGKRARGFFENRVELVKSGDREALYEALRSDTAAQVVSNVDIDELTKWRMKAIGDGRGYINAARAMIGVADQPLTPELSQISTDVDVIGATEDAFCPRKASEILLDAIPDAHFQEIERAGHLMNVDRPKAVTAALRNALTRQRA